MTYLPNVINVSVMPHLFSRLDKDTKKVYRQRYRKAKQVGIATAFSSLTLVDGAILLRDISASKLTAYGYKSLFALTVGPIIQFISLPMYIFSYGTKFRSYALIVHEVGAKIVKGEFGIANAGWCVADLCLFGEIVPITDNVVFGILLNETESSVFNVVEVVKEVTND